MTRCRLLLFSAVVVELLSLAGLQALGDLRIHTAPFLVLFTAAIAAFAWACRLLDDKVRLRTIVLIALALRLPLLFTQPSLSDDVWRYLHDGRAQASGINPFALAPGDQRTSSFRGPEFTRINHPDLVTIYPPGAQLAFFANALLGSKLLSWRLLLIAAELLLLVALAGLLARRGLGPSNLALYAWHPLAVVEGVGSAHIEPIGVALLMAGLLAAEREQAFSAGVLLGLSTAVKLVTAPLLAVSEHVRNPKLVTSALGTLLILYAIYSLGGFPFGSLATFAVRWEANASIYSLIAFLTDGHRARILAATLLLCAIVIIRSAQLGPGDRMATALLAILLFSPVVHPWYLLWLLAFVPLVSIWWLRWVALVWSVTVVLSYWSAELRWFEYTPVYALLCAAGVTAARRRFQARTLVPSAGKTQRI